MRTLFGSAWWLWLWLWFGCSGGTGSAPAEGIEGPPAWFPFPAAGPPRLDGVTPTVGPNLGGPIITLSGERFAADATVTVDGIAASQVYVWSGNRITARLPTDRGVVGPVTVVVRNPDGAEARVDGAFRYYAGPLPFAGAVFGPANITAVAGVDFNQDGLVDLAAVSSAGLYVMLNDGLGGFGAATSFAVGATPTAVVTGDWNGDGRPDLAVANNGSATISVLLGNGAGWFSAAASLSVGSKPMHLIAGDWNNDGKPDLAVANNGSASVTVLLGGGDGGFASAGNLTVGTTPVALAVGDWNGDGWLDLAVANNGSRTVSMLWGNGAGAFAGPSSYALAAAPVSLVGGDWNRDGLCDLAVASGVGKNVSLLLGNGQGGFAPATSIPLGSAPLSISSGDWSGDGNPDLLLAFAATSSTGSLRVLVGDGAGGFASGSTVPVLAAPTAGIPLFRDFNGDLIPDAAIAATTGVVLLLGEEAGGLRSASLALPRGVAPELEAGDFNGDAKPDVVVLDYNQNSIVAILGDGQGGILATSEQSTISFGGFGRPLVGDWDGDGKQDVMVASIAGVAPIWGHGDGSFTLGSNVPVVGSTLGGLQLATGDFDGDQNSDLVVANFDLGVVQVLFGDGRRGFPLGVTYVPASGVRAVTAADLNNDGKLDLAVGGGSGITLYFGDGSRTFFSQSRLSTPASVLVTGDLNGDGNLDIVAGSSVLLLGNGRGEFPVGASYPGGGCASVADWNGDKFPDLLGGGSILLGNGQGGFSSSVSFARSQRCPAAVDLNRDQRMDLVLSAADGVYLLLNQVP